MAPGSIQRHLGLMIAALSPVTVLLATLLDAVAIAVLVRVVYLHERRIHNFAFLLTVSNAVVLVVAVAVDRVDLATGAFVAVLVVGGLAGMQHRTVSVRDLAYLFASCTLGLINGLADQWVPWPIALLATVGLVGLLFVLSNVVFSSTGTVCEVTYDNLENLHRDRRAELYWDLWERLGLDVVNVAVNHIDLHAGTAQLNVRYRVPATFSDRVHQALSPPASTQPWSE